VGDARASVIVNVTPLGMAGPDEHELSFGDDAIGHADNVFDVVAVPTETPLIVKARAAGKLVITGADVIALQAAEQFARYTGVRPNPESVAAAARFSRS
jgi:shikimate dehydrogenase